MQPTDIEAVIDDLRGCVIGEITLVAQNVHLALETPRQQQLTLHCIQATVLNTAAQVAELPGWTRWARTIDWADVFETDTLGLALCNGQQLFIRMTGAELVQSCGR
jgi:hypothetical protein